MSTMTNIQNRCLRHHLVGFKTLRAVHIATAIPFGNTRLSSIQGIDTGIPVRCRISCIKLLAANIKSFAAKAEVLEIDIRQRKKILSICREPAKQNDAE